MNIAETTLNGNGSRIGVYVCRCGLNIAQTVDCEKVAGNAKGMDDVVVSKDIPYACSEPGQMEIKEDIREHGLDRIVIGRYHPSLNIVDGLVIDRSGRIRSHTREYGHDLDLPES